MIFYFVLYILKLLLLCFSKANSEQVQTQLEHLLQNNEIQNVSFQYDTNYKQICHANNYKLIRPFLEEQWYQARKDLNLSKHSDLFSDPEKLKSVHNRYIDKMYHFRYYLDRVHQHNNFNKGVHLFQVNGTLIGYLRLLKCGSRGIVANFNQYMQKEGFKYFNHKNYLVFHNRQDVIKFKQNLTTHSIDTFSGYQKPIHLTSEGLRTKHSQFKVFTYIRHPIMKLEAGWSQAINQTPGLQLNKISIETIRNWFIDILNYKNLNNTKPLVFLNHIYPISGAFLNLMSIFY